MTQILDCLPCGKKEKILCCYANTTRFVQIARISIFLTGTLRGLCFQEIAYCLKHCRRRN